MLTTTGRRQSGRVRVWPLSYSCLTQVVRTTDEPWDHELDGHPLCDTLDIAAEVRLGNPRLSDVLANSLQLCNVTVPELAKLWLKPDDCAELVSKHPILGPLEPNKEPPVVQFMNGSYRKPPTFACLTLQSCVRHVPSRG